MLCDNSIHMTQLLPSSTNECLLHCGILGALSRTTQQNTARPPRCCGEAAAEYASERQILGVITMQERSETAILLVLLPPLRHKGPLGFQGNLLECVCVPVLGIL